MNTFIIIDGLGARRGTIKAESRADAINAYIGIVPTDAPIKSMIFAVNSSEFKLFAKQIYKLSTKIENINN